MKVNKEEMMETILAKPGTGAVSDLEQKAKKEGRKTLVLDAKWIHSETLFPTVYFDKAGAAQTKDPTLLATLQSASNMAFIVVNMDSANPAVRTALSEALATVSSENKIYNVVFK